MMSNSEQQIVVENYMFDKHAHISKDIIHDNCDELWSIIDHIIRYKDLYVKTKTSEISKYKEYLKPFRLEEYISMQKDKKIIDENNIINYLMFINNNEKLFKYIFIMYEYTEGELMRLLIFLMKSNNLELLKFIITSKIDNKILSKYKYIIFDCAIYVRNLDMIKYFVEDCKIIKSNELVYNNKYFLRMSILTSLNLELSDEIENYLMGMLVKDSSSDEYDV